MQSAELDDRNSKLRAATLEPAITAGLDGFASLAMTVYGFTDDTERLDMTAFLGGSPASVAVRLLVVSFVVGLLLAMFGFDPEVLYERFEGLVRHIIEFGLTDFRHFGRILLTGAMVVVPVWFILRLMDARRAR